MKLKIDQLMMVTAIVNEINRQNGGCLSANSDIFNASISCANELIDKTKEIDALTVEDEIVDICATCGDEIETSYPLGNEVFCCENCANDFYS